MQKSLIRIAALSLVALLALQAFAEYTVVLKDGTRYKAKQKYTIQNGKALIQLTSGQTLQVDPALIDVAKSEQITRLGVNANIVDLNTNMPTGVAPAQPQTSLGDQVRLRQRTAKTPAPAPAQQPAATTPPPVSTGTGSLPLRVIDTFDKAYENVSIFEKEIKSTGPRSLRAQVTVDNEDHVFNAISATAFLITRNAGVDDVQIDMVELFMKTTTGGAAGRFQMTRADAEALTNKTISQQDYFVRKVIY